MTQSPASQISGIRFVPTVTATYPQHSYVQIRRTNGFQKWYEVTMSYLILCHRHNSRVQCEQCLRNLHTVLLEISKDIRRCARAIGIAKQL